MADREGTAIAGAAPRTATEERLGAIWREVLRVETIGADDDFFVLGGHSLLAGGARVLARPELTAERFVPDPFPAEPGARLYRTGDLARRQPAGEVEYLGRLDHQVKVRGFRIELREIEAALERHPVVAAAVVTAGGRSMDAQLTAWVVCHPGCAVESRELRGFLAQSLPGYMVPARFVLRDRLPLTASGKIDRAALQG